MIFFQGKNTENKKWPFNPTNILMKETIDRLINVLQIYQIPAEQKQEKKKNLPLSCALWCLLPALSWNLVNLYKQPSWKLPRAASSITEIESPSCQLVKKMDIVPGLNSSLYTHAIYCIYKTFILSFLYPEPNLSL